MSSLRKDVRFGDMLLLEFQLAPGGWGGEANGGQPVPHTARTPLCRHADLNADLSHLRANALTRWRCCSGLSFQ